jgi:hypothetical protein
MKTVIETPTYLRQAKAAGASWDELDTIVREIADDPERGDIIPGTGGACKRRFARAGQGKRGGYRVIFYTAAEDVPVFLLALMSKGQRADLTQGERNELRQVLGGIAEAYRASVRAKVQTLRGRVR